MNIFVTSNNAILAANYLDIKRQNKMLIESVQMLCTALHSVGIDAPYKPTHRNHPCNVWVRERALNYLWLWKHADAMGRNYTARTGKIHKSAMYLPFLREQSYHLPGGVMTPFVNCATNHKHIDDIHEAYKQELDMKWKSDKRTPLFDKNHKNYVQS